MARSSLPRTKALCATNASLAAPAKLGLGHASADDWASVDVTKFLLYGGAFSVAVDFVVYPLELVTTRVQVDARSTATLLDATVRGFRGVLASEGPAGLWRGFTLATVGGLPSQGAYFLGYGWAHDALTAANGRRAEGARAPLVAVDAAAGFFADAVASPLWTPAEVITARMQIQGPGVVKYASASHAARHIVETEGVRGLFRGLTVSVLAFGPASALWWAIYQSTHRSLAAWEDGRRAAAAAGVGAAAGAPAAAAAAAAAARAPAVATPAGATPAGAAPPAPAAAPAAPAAPRRDVWIDALAGGLAGSVTAVVTNPLDMAKTRLQTQHALLREYALPADAPAAAAPARAGGGAGAGASTGAGAGASAGASAGAGAGASAADVRRGRPSAGAPRAAAGGTRAPAGIMLPRLTAAGAVRAAAGALGLGGVGASGGAASSGVAGGGGGGGARVPPAGVSSAAPSAGSAGGGAYGSPHAFPHAAAHAGAAAAAGRPVLHAGLIPILVALVRADGPRALIRGLLPRLLMQGPASALTFVAYEEVKRLSRKPEAE